MHRIRSRTTETDIIRFCCRKLPRILKWVRLFRRRRFHPTSSIIVVGVVIIISFRWFLFDFPSNKNNWRTIYRWSIAHWAHYIGYVAALCHPPSTSSSSSSSSPVPTNSQENIIAKNLRTKQHKQKQSKYGTKNNLESLVVAKSTNEKENIQRWSEQWAASKKAH